VAALKLCVAGIHVEPEAFETLVAIRSAPSVAASARSFCGTRTFRDDENERPYIQQISFTSK